MTDHRCLGVNKSGLPCASPPMAGADWCCQHNPAIPDSTKRQWSKNGGDTHTRNLEPGELPLDLESNKACVQSLTAITAALIDGKISLSIARPLIAAINAAIRAHEQPTGDLIRQMEKLVKRGGR